MVEPHTQTPVLAATSETAPVAQVETTPDVKTAEPIVKPEKEPEPSNAVDTPAPAPSTTPPMATPAPVTEPRTVEVPKEEPQNALTQAFTQAEWTALKEFRVSTNSAITDRFPHFAYRNNCQRYSQMDTLTRRTIRMRPSLSGASLLILGNQPTTRVSALSWSSSCEPGRLYMIFMCSLVVDTHVRNFNVKAAREMLVNTLRWRDEIGIDALMKEEFPQEIFGALGHIYKTDKQGRPVS